MPEFSSNLPLSLYVHFPWCVRKCPYCDFNSHAVTGNIVNDNVYVEALIRDLEFELPRIRGRRIGSVFLGGGTPSLFSVEAVARLLSVLRSHLNLTPGCEITLEANPGTAETARFTGYRETGVNRLSIGVQSFSDPVLRRLGRVHDGGQAVFAIELARRAGFENINLDIMYGLPGQTVAEALQDLEIAAGFNTAHLSWYQLTIEPNTVFYSDPPVLPGEDALWEMQEQGIAYLAGHGLRQYEVSAYAKNDRYCAHNLNYWRFGDYLGIGAGAHGKLTSGAAGCITRYARHRLPDQYMKLAGRTEAVVTEQRLSDTDAVLEFMMNAMRLTDGVPAELFTEHTGLSLDAADRELRLSRDRQLIDYDGRRIKPTALGRRYLNDLLQIFMHP
jgi:oxygen-independent coproporphyrinogen-3 oxidase